ncbi:MAG: hypothetical protein HUU50_09780 [Candidatus Brocadiae bacterium]|nr:hypothetical protein [Candidatus Brocadiia bacterium]
MEKKSLCADACSLIYLYRCDILRHAVRWYNFYTTPEILQELSVKASGKELQSYYNVTEVFHVPNTRTRKGLSSNDQSLIDLFYQQRAYAVLSEDGKILQFCKKNQIQHFCSLSLICELVKKQEFSMDQALLKLEFLIESGRYAPWVVQQAYSMLKESVASI